jgi:hypothetical protein
MTSSPWDSTSEPHQTPPANLPTPISGPVLPPGGGYGMPMPYDNDPVIMTIGDIGVTRTQVIVPTGRYPLRGTTWTVQDSTQVSESIPAYAIVLVVLFVWFCLLGLLFLLIKEKRYSGFVSVTVTGPNLFHAVQFPPGPQPVAMVTHQVNQARALAAAA